MRRKTDLDVLLGGTGWTPYHPAVARAFVPYVPRERGYLSVSCALFLATCWKWSGRSTRHRAGWFDKCDADFASELGVSDRQFRAVREIVCARLGLVSRRQGRAGVSLYCLDCEVVSSWWALNGPQPALSAAEPAAEPAVEPAVEPVAEPVAEPASSYTGVRTSSYAGVRTTKKTQKDIGGGGETDPDNENLDRVWQLLSEAGVWRNARTKKVAARLAMEEFDRVARIVRAERARLSASGSVRDVSAALVAVLEAVDVSRWQAREPGRQPQPGREPGREPGRDGRRGTTRRLPQVGVTDEHAELYRRWAAQRRAEVEAEE